MTTNAPLLPKVETSNPLDQADLLMRTRKFSEALALLQQLAEAEPQNPAVLHALSDCYSEMGLVNQSLFVLDTLCETWPEDLNARGKAGMIRLSMGDKKAASAAFRKVLEASPMSAPALVALNLVETFAASSPEAARLRQLAGSPDLPQGVRAAVCNAIGQIEDAADNAATAMRFFAEAKAETPGSYPLAEYDKMVAEQQQAFFPGSFAEARAEGAAQRFAFVTGLPRSGTTLLEAMLGRHPEIGSIGENPGLGQALITARQLVQEDAPLTSHWHWTKHATEADLTALRSMFLQMNVPGALRSRAVIVDKQPQNSFNLGFARMILPDAKFIFMMRHPLDVGLSAFSKDFAEGQAFSKRLEWIGHQIRTVYASLDDYLPKLGNRLRLQSYRALVEQPEQQLRQILDHLDLEWNPACLRPEDYSGAVNTASLVQIREGINTKGLGKWNRYESELAPLVDALGGWDWIREWEQRDAALCSSKAYKASSTFSSLAASASAPNGALTTNMPEPTILWPSRAGGNLASLRSAPGSASASSASSIGA